MKYKVVEEHEGQTVEIALIIEMCTKAGVEELIKKPLYLLHSFVWGEELVTQ